jgi:hypothetical protein
MLMIRNTKTGIYLDAIHSSQSCMRVVQSTPKPNAVTRLEEIDREETCLLGLAGDMMMMLIEGLLRLEDGLEKCSDEVARAELNVSNDCSLHLVLLLFGKIPSPGRVQC